MKLGGSKENECDVIDVDADNIGGKRVGGKEEKSRQFLLSGFELAEKDRFCKSTKEWFFGILIIFNRRVQYSY